jgi:lysophospholipase L1-like esterase
VGRFRSRLLSALLALAGLGVSLLLAEGVARRRWVAPWYQRLLTEQRGWQRPHHHLNRLGLRGPDVEIPKPASVHRVLVLGDSFTYGLGVRKESAPFPAVLQRQLNGDWPRRRGPYEVVNGGISGSLTGQWVELLRRVGPQLEPDVVLAVFFLRDGTRDRTISDFFGVIRDEIAQRNAESALYQASYLTRWIRDLQDRQRVARAYTETLLDAYFGAGEQTAQWHLAQRHLLVLRDRAQAQGAVFGLAVFPVLVELDEGYPFRAISDLLMEFAAAHGIPAHDLLPAFLGREAADLWVSPLDQHPNEAGHAVAADSLLPFVRALLEQAATRDGREAGDSRPTRSGLSDRVQRGWKSAAGPTSHAPLLP